MTNNYYVDEYSRLVNRITLDEERLNRLVEQVSVKTKKNNNDNFKQIVLVAAVKLLHDHREAHQQLTAIALD